jgi:hypothetical protein
VVFVPQKVGATALTYKLEANEKACFYAWVDKVNEKIAFYFAVNPLCDGIDGRCKRADHSTLTTKSRTPISA